MNVKQASSEAAQVLRDGTTGVRSGEVSEGPRRGSASCAGGWHGARGRPLRDARLIGRWFRGRGEEHGGESERHGGFDGLKLEQPSLNEL